MNLVRAEWKRLFGRRFTWVMFLVTAAVLAIVVLGVGLSSQRPTAENLAKAERIATEQRAQVEQTREECRRSKADPSAPSGPSGPSDQQFPAELDCDRAFDPAQVRTEDFLPHVFSFRDEGAPALTVLGGLAALFGFAVAGSFVGAEWSTGGMTNLLLWRPRRVPVLATKLGTALAGVTALGLAAGALYMAGLWVMASTRGSTSGMTSSVWQSLALTGARSLVLALAAATIGFGLASLGRHTATALGIAIGYVIVGEVGAQIVFALAEVTRPQRFQLSSYVGAWLSNGLTFTDFSSCTEQGPCEPVEWSVSLGSSVIVGGTVLVLVVAAAFWQITRRDVT